MNIFFRCPHKNVRLVWTKYSSYGQEFAARQLRQQCTDCGQLFGSSLKHSSALPDTPELTREEATRPHIEEEARRAQWWEQKEKERYESEQRRRDDYDNYLQSPEWRARRAHVLRRAGGLCEGCREAKAVQVHHLTYTHVRNEFLWQLVAICRDCHARYHGVANDDEVWIDGLYASARSS